MARVAKGGEARKGFLARTAAKAKNFLTALAQKGAEAAKAAWGKTTGAFEAAKTAVTGAAKKPLASIATWMSRKKLPEFGPGDTKELGVRPEHQEAQYTWEREWARPSDGPRGLYRGSQMPRPLMTKRLTPVSDPMPGRPGTPDPFIGSYIGSKERLNKFRPAPTVDDATALAHLAIQEGLSEAEAEELLQHYLG